MLWTASRMESLAEALALVCPPEMLTLGDARLYRGPSPASSRPAICFTLKPGPEAPDVTELTRKIAGDFPAFDEQVRAGRVRATKPETLASIVARLAAAFLAEALYLDVASGSRRKSRTEAWFEYYQERSGVQALKAALVAVGSSISGAGRGPASAEAAKVGVMVKRYGPNPEAALMITAARKRHIPFLQIAGNHALWQFGWGCRSEHFWVTSSNADGMVAHRLATDKNVAKKLMRELGIPTPADVLVVPGGDVEQTARMIGWPCVVKPRSGGSGAGVTTGISDPDLLRQAVELARKNHPHVMIEAQVQGEDHRLMVVDGTLVAAVRRERPFVIGNGQSTIGALIEAFNAPRMGDKRSTGYLSPVPRDSALALSFASQNVAEDSIVPRGEKIFLRGNANRSTGGTPVDVLDQVHPQVRYMAEELAGAFGFRATGIDYITTDISRSPEESGGGVIELNITPGLDVLLAAGMDKDAIASLILGMRPGRIPIRLLLAGKEDCENIGSALRERLTPTLGAASADWVQIGDLTLPAEALDPVGRAQLLLRYPTVEAAVILWDLETLNRYGLPVDSIAETIVVGTPPSGEWHAVIEKNSKRLATGIGVSRAVDMLLRTPVRNVARTRKTQPHNEN